MTTAVFTLNLLAAAGLLAAIAFGPRLRTMVAFHVAGVAVAAALYATLTLLSLSEMPADGPLPAWPVFRLLAAGFAYGPFAVFLVISYLVFLRRVANEPVVTVSVKLETAEDEINLGQLHRAAQVLREILDSDPENVDAHALMAEVHIRRGEHSKAVGSLRLAMAQARSPEDFARFVFKAATILGEEMGDFKAAAKELDLIRKRMPDTPEAQRAQKRILEMMDQEAKEDEGRRG